MLTELEITLQQALQDFGLRELPEEWNPAKSDIIDGIALVSKIGGIRNYCKVAADGNGKLSVKRDYGKSLRIQEIEKVYAVHVIEKRFKPGLHNDNDILTFLRFSEHPREELESLLSTEGKTEEQIKRDRAIVDGYVQKATLDSAKQTLKEEERCKELKEYSKRIKTAKNERKNSKKTPRAKKESN